MRGMDITESQLIEHGVIFQVISQLLSIDKLVRENRAKEHDMDVLGKIAEIFEGLTYHSKKLDIPFLREVYGEFDKTGVQFSLIDHLSCVVEEDIVKDFLKTIENLVTVEDRRIKKNCLYTLSTILKLIDQRNVPTELLRICVNILKYLSEVYDKETSKTEVLRSCSESRLEICDRHRFFRVMVSIMIKKKDIPILKNILVAICNYVTKFGEVEFSDNIEKKKFEEKLLVVLKDNRTSLILNSLDTIIALVRSKSYVSLIFLSNEIQSRTEDLLKHKNSSIVSKTLEVLSTFAKYEIKFSKNSFLKKLILLMPNSSNNAEIGNCMIDLLKFGDRSELSKSVMLRIIDVAGSLLNRDFYDDEIVLNSLKVLCRIWNFTYLEEETTKSEIESKLQFYKYHLIFVLKMEKSDMIYQLNLILKAAKEKKKRKKKICSNCGKGGAKKKCRGCYSVFYCDKVCQRRNWNSHKKLCKNNPKSKQQPN